MKSTGMELALRYDFNDASYISSNYTYLDAEKEGLVQANIPQHSVSLMAGTRLLTQLGATLSLYWQDETPRENGDTRNSLDGYTLVDTSLQYSGVREDITVDFSIHNLFNTEYQYPSPPPAFTIINDYPASGRSFMLGIKVRF